MQEETIPTFDGVNYEERVKQLESRYDKEKKGILNDLQEERKTRQSLEQRLQVIESSLSSAGSDDGETVEQKVQRLASQPDEYINQRIQEYDESRVKVLEGELNSLKLDRQIERGLRWVAKQEKKDYDEVAGSDLEESLARKTMEMRSRGLIPTDPYEGTKQAYKLLLEERQENKTKEKEREERIDSNRSESVHLPPKMNVRWTRGLIRNLSPKQFDEHYDEIKEAEKLGLITEN